MKYLSPDERKTIYIAAAKVHQAKFEGLYSPIPAVLHLYGEESKDMAKVLPELTMFDSREAKGHEYLGLSGALLLKNIEVMALLLCAAMTEYKRV